MVLESMKPKTIVLIESAPSEAHFLVYEKVVFLLCGHRMQRV